MRRWACRVASMDVDLVVEAETRSRARYLCWRQAREAGYRIEFSEIAVRLAGGRAAALALAEEVLREAATPPWRDSDPASLLEILRRRAELALAAISESRRR